MTDYAAYLGLSLDEDQKMILEMVEQLSSEMLAPAAESIDHEESIPAEIREALAESGLFGLRAPESFGGVELDDTTYQFSLATLAHGSASVALDVLLQSSGVIEPLAKFGADNSDLASWAETLVGGESRGALAWQEESNSLDVAHLSAEILQEGGKTVLRGTKQYVLGATDADRFLVLAKEGDGCSWVVVEATENVKVGDTFTRLGMRGVNAATVTFEDVVVEDALRLGAAGQGEPVFRYVISRMQTGIVALATGLIAAARDAAALYSTERHQFERPISDFEAIREKLAHRDRVTDDHTERHKIHVGDAMLEPQSHKS